MAIMVAIAPFLGTNSSLSAERNDAQGEVYYDSTGFSITTAARSRYDAASNLVTIAEKYTDQNPALAELIDELEYAMQKVNASYGVNIVKTSHEITEPAHALAEALEQMELSEEDSKYPANLVSELDSLQDKIYRSSYNEAAESFNEILNSFPVNFFSILGNTEELPIAQK